MEQRESAISIIIDIGDTDWYRIGIGSMPNLTVSPTTSAHMDEPHTPPPTRPHKRLM